MEQDHIQKYQEFNKEWDELMQKTALENEEATRIMEEKHVK